MAIPRWIGWPFPEHLPSALTSARIAISTGTWRFDVSCIATATSGTASRSATEA